MVCLTLPVIAFPTLLSPLYRQLGAGLFALFLFTAFTLLMAPLIAVPQIYLARALRPLLADAPPTDERIKLAEQLPTVAAVVSTKWLVIGLVSGVAMMVASGLALLDAFMESGHAGSALFNSSILAVMGGLLTFYFIYLLRLKAKVKPVQDFRGNEVRSRNGRWSVDPGFPTKVGGRHVTGPRAGQGQLPERSIRPREYCS